MIEIQSRGFQHAEHLYGRGAAFGDFDNDGMVDILVNPINDLPILLKCESTSANNWITLKLIGTKSNRSAIGAQVTLFWNGQQQMQEVSGGSGFAAQNQRRLHFGLGKYPQMEKAVIRWPSGKLQTIDKPAAGQLLKIKEPV